jgi:predicted transcriptional regulator
MNTLELKSELHQLIDSLEDEAVLQSFYTLLIRQQNAPSDFWEKLNQMQKADIEAGIADLDAGKAKKIAEVLKKYQ